jgi:uncharacterized membrane protein YgdD (TMEM256/DUF423 family)
LIFDFSSRFMNSSTAFRIAAVFGLLAVALGAFGAHGLGAVFKQNGLGHRWETATLYHIVHAVVLLAIARGENFSRLAWWLIAAGILLFSGSLYLYAATGIRSFALFTPPIGGLALMGGWLALAIRGAPRV